MSRTNTVSLSKLCILARKQLEPNTVPEIVDNEGVLINVVESVLHQVNAGNNIVIKTRHDRACEDRM